MIRLLDPTIPNYAKDTPIEWVAAQVLYRYLIKGQGVREIEYELFGHEDLHGFFSKCLLNFYNIDTSRESKNRGTFSGLSLQEVISILLSSGSPCYIAIARTLKLLVP